MTAELLTTVPVGNLLGEGILWNARRQSAWWTDIERSMLFEYEPATESLKSWETPHRVACFGFVEGGENLIVAFDRGIALYDVTTGRVDWLVPPNVLADGIRFNDGKVDPAGRFWVGTMVENPAIASVSGSLYSFDPTVGLIEHVREVGISNGLCWSPDGTRMYHADSRANTIHAWDFDAVQGAVANRRMFAKTTKNVAPDGSTVDRDGGVWNAQWGGSRVVRYDQEGRITREIDMPVSQPTCVAFGGANLDLLFVTTAREGLSDEQLADEHQAGDVLIFQVDTMGLPASEWRPVLAKE